MCHDFDERISVFVVFPCNISELELFYARRSNVFKQTELLLLLLCVGTVFTINCVTHGET